MQSPFVDAVKLSVPIDEDSWNTMPQDFLEFIITDAWVRFRVEGDRERSITIGRCAMEKLAKFLLMTMPECNH